MTSLVFIKWPNERLITLHKEMRFIIGDVIERRAANVLQNAAKWFQRGKEREEEIRVLCANSK